MPAAEEPELDSLTGLKNRRALEKAFDRVRRESEAARSTLAVAVLDLDHFRVVNERHGRGDGDRVLQGVAAVLSSALGREATVARAGDDSFVALLPEADRAGAVRILERALSAVRKERIQSSDGRRIPVAFSAGVVEVPPGGTLDEAVGAAQQLLYLAKAAGRNRVFSATDKHNAAAKKILLVDDGETFASIIKHMLGREDFEIIHVTDGETAVSTAPRAGVSMVLLDVAMPGMDGFEVLEKLRENPSLDEVPILMVTRRANKADVTKALELGANDYVVKPFKPQDLLARVRRFLG